MKNYIQSGTNLTLPAPANVDSGDGVLIGSIFGIAAGDAAMGDDVDLVTTGVFSLPKVGALAIGLGAKVYWDDGDKLVTTDDDEGANMPIGVAVKAAANPSAAVSVRLNGAF